MKRKQEPDYLFCQRGFTEKGLVEYGKLRHSGITRDKAIDVLIARDMKLRQTFIHRRRPKRKSVIGLKATW